MTPASNQTDRELIRRLQAGDEHAFTQLYERLRSLSAKLESQNRELQQLRESKRFTEGKLNRAIMDIDRICGDPGNRPNRRIVPAPPDLASRPHPCPVFVCPNTSVRLPWPPR